MKYNEIKQALCNIILKKNGIVICSGDCITYKTEMIDVITDFRRFKMYDDFVVIFTKNNSYMYSLERIFALISYKEWRNIRENCDPTHINTAVPVFYVCQLEQERIDQQQAYNDYEFQNFLNQSKEFLSNN